MQDLIFALIGPSGSGKSALVDEMILRFPNDLELIRSLTTRPKRSFEDGLASRHVSKEEFLNFIAAKELVQWIEYDGQLYGDARSDIEAIFNKRKFGIRPLVEAGVKNFRNQGYKVVVVKIIPSGSGYQNRSVSREILDAKRDKESFAADLEIENQFDVGGFVFSCNTLSSFIEEQIKIHKQ